jgi:hypothetical protein
LPTPKRLETVDDTYVLEEIREQPQPGLDREHCYAEEDEAEYCHEEEQA